MTARLDHNRLFFGLGADTSSQEVSIQSIDTGIINADDLIQKALPQCEAPPPCLDCTYKVTVIGTNQNDPAASVTFPVKPGDYILDVAEFYGHNIPYECRAGACNSCRGKLITGDLDMDEQSYLDDDKINAKCVLTCVAIPFSDLTIDIRPESTTECN